MRLPISATSMTWKSSTGSPSFPARKRAYGRAVSAVFEPSSGRSNRVYIVVPFRWANADGEALAQSLCQATATNVCSKLGGLRLRIRGAFEADQIAADVNRVG